MIYLTSDTHFCHDKSFLYNPRGFTSIVDHNETIVKNWNSIIDDNDIVYHLGDVILNNDDIGMNYLRQLKGQIKLIRGNHDSDRRWERYKELPNVELLGYANVLKYKKFTFYLSHFPTLCSNYDDKGLRNRVINLCGHSHTKDKFADAEKGVIYHVELDAHNNTPVCIDNIIQDLRNYWSALPAPNAVDELNMNVANMATTINNFTSSSENFCKAVEKSYNAFYDALHHYFR